MNTPGSSAFTNNPIAMVMRGLQEDVGSLPLTTDMAIPTTDSTTIDLELLGTILSIIGPLTYLYLQVSSSGVARQMHREKSTKLFTPQPFLWLIANGWVWVCYGVLVGNISIILPNVTATMFGFLYLGMFWYYSEPASRPKLGIAMALLMCAAASAVSLLVDVDVAQKIIGFTGGATAGVLMISPLAVMATVIKIKNTSPLSFSTSIATVLNAVVWLIYSFIINDIMLTIPNSVGLAAGLLQCGLFIMYPRASLDEVKQVTVATVPSIEQPEGDLTKVYVKCPSPCDRPKDHSENNKLGQVARTDSDGASDEV